MVRIGSRTIPWHSDTIHHHYCFHQLPPTDSPHKCRIGDIYTLNILKSHAPTQRRLEKSVALGLSLNRCCLPISLQFMHLGLDVSRRRFLSEGMSPEISLGFAMPNKDNNSTDCERNRTERGPQSETSSRIWMWSSGLVAV